MHPKFFCAMLLLGSACGNDKTSTDTPVRAKVSGTVQVLPFDSAPYEFSQITLVLADPASLITNPDAQPLASTTLDTSAASCTPNGCPWSIDDVDITNLALGLVAAVVDQRPQGSTQWATTYTGIASPDTLAAARSNKAPLTGVVVSAITAAGFANIAHVTGLSTAELTRRGALIGLVVGKASEASAATNNQPPPVAGAKVTTSLNQVSIWYPRADFAAAVDNNDATSAAGVFIAVPDSPMLALGVWNIAAAADDTSHTWAPVSQVGSNPGGILFLGFPANP